MVKRLENIIQDLPPGRQKKISDLADKKVEEMIAHASTLTDFRKAVGKTQAEIAKELGINQNAVSQLEKRSDTYVSTLRRFLSSLGLQLELSVVAKNGARIDLPHFFPAEVPAARNLSLATKKSKLKESIPSDSSNKKTELARRSTRNSLKPKPN